MRPPNVFAAHALDRVSHMRQDAQWLEDRLRSDKSRVALVWRSRCLIQGSEAPTARFLPITATPELVKEARCVVLLGVEGDVTYFAADVSHLEEPQSPEIPHEDEFADLRQVGARLEAREGNLLAYARAMATWHDRHRFCGVCGSPTESTQAGHLRVCQNPDCKAEHFPRTDPAVIMLVHDGDKALLGRQASWPSRVYSTLAGFVEPGESLENAVAREVFEESGIRVDDVRYHSSQPWPFPSSLMLGFHARACGGTLSVEGSELEDAIWLTREQIYEGQAMRELLLPQRLSIARRLIDDWLESG